MTPYATKGGSTWLVDSERCTPNGIRTRVTALKGRGPRPLADGGAGAGYRSGRVVRPCRKAFQRRLEVVPGLGLRLGVVRSIHVAGQLEIPLPGGFSRERKDRCVLAGGHVLVLRSPGRDSSHPVGSITHVAVHRAPVAAPVRSVPGPGRRGFRSRAGGRSRPSCRTGRRPAPPPPPPLRRW